MSIENELFNEQELELLPLKTIQTFSYPIIDIFIKSIIKINEKHKGIEKWRKLIQILTPYQITLISPELIPLFTNKYLLLHTLTKKQIPALTKKQIEKLTPEQISELSCKNFSAFEKGIRTIKKTMKRQTTLQYDLHIFYFQIQALTEKQITWLKPAQKAAFTEEQIKAFTPKQRTAFNINKTEAATLSRSQELNSNFNQENINTILMSQPSSLINDPTFPSW